jgi:chromosome partitioning protein
LRLVISNQRGGVSKTTTTATFARFFADQGFKVLAIDTDPQGSLGLVLGLKPQKYLHDFVVFGAALEECVLEAAPGIHILCSNRDTTRVEVMLLGMNDREWAFSRLLGAVDHSYDLVLIDVAPSINLVQTCSLLYAQHLLIPVAMDMLSLQGAVACLETASLLGDLFETQIQPVALLPVRVDRRFSLTASVTEALNSLSGKYGVPVLHPVRTDGTVPRAERAHDFLADFDPGCKAAEDYTLASRQLMELLHVGQPAVSYAQALSA